MKSSSSVLLVLASLSAIHGCGRSDDSPFNPAKPVGPPQAVEVKDVPEDPEVEAYFKKKKWHLYDSPRIIDHKRMKVLDIANMEKPFEPVVLTPEDFKVISRTKSIRDLCMRNVVLSDETLGWIVKIPQLESLDASFTEVTDAGLKHLAQCKSLEILFLLHGDKITDEGLKELAALTRLKQLYLFGGEFTGRGMKNFVDLKDLQYLTLNFCKKFDDEGAGYCRLSQV